MECKYCSRCGRQIVTAWRTSKGNYYHPHCFTCALCGVAIQSTTRLENHCLKEIYCSKCCVKHFSEGTVKLLVPPPPPPPVQMSSQGLGQRVTTTMVREVWDSDYTTSDFDTPPVTPVGKGPYYPQTQHQTQTRPICTPTTESENEGGSLVNSYKIETIIKATKPPHEGHSRIPKLQKSSPKIADILSASRKKESSTSYHALSRRSTSPGPSSKLKEEFSSRSKSRDKFRNKRSSSSSSHAQTFMERPGAPSNNSSKSRIRSPSNPGLDANFSYARMKELQVQRRQSAPSSKVMERRSVVSAPAATTTTSALVPSRGSSSSCWEYDHEGQIWRNTDRPPTPDPKPGYFTIGGGRRPNEKSKRYMLPAEIMGIGKGGRKSQATKVVATPPPPEQEPVPSTSKGNPNHHPKTINIISRVGLDCPICLDTLVDGGGRGQRENMVSCCGHIFHKECIHNWLSSDGNGRCPTCSKLCVKDSLIPVYLEDNNAADNVNQDTNMGDLRSLVHTLRQDYKTLREKYEKLEQERQACETKCAVNDSLKMAYDMEIRTRRGLQWENRQLQQKLEEIHALLEQNDTSLILSQRPMTPI